MGNIFRKFYFLPLQFPTTLFCQGIMDVKFIFFRYFTLSQVWPWTSPVMFQLHNRICHPSASTPHSSSLTPAGNWFINKHLSELLSFLLLNSLFSKVRPKTLLRWLFWHSNTKIFLCVCVCVCVCARARKLAPRNHFIPRVVKCRTQLFDYLPLLSSFEPGVAFYKSTSSMHGTK